MVLYQENQCCRRLRVVPGDQCRGNTILLGLGLTSKNSLQNTSIVRQDISNFFSNLELLRFDTAYNDKGFYLHETTLTKVKVPVAIYSGMSKLINEKDLKNFHEY